MSTQPLQGTKLKLEFGKIWGDPTTLMPAQRNVLISPNETTTLYSGSFVKKDTTRDDNSVIKASSTTPPSLVSACVRHNIADDIPKSSQGAETDINYPIQNNVNVVRIDGSKNLYGQFKSGDVINIDDHLMIDDTDDERRSLVPFVKEADGQPKTYSIGIAITTSTAGGQMIQCRFTDSQL